MVFLLNVCTPQHPTHFPVAPCAHLHVWAVASKGRKSLHTLLIILCSANWTFHRRASTRRLIVSRSDGMHLLGDYFTSLLQRLRRPEFCPLVCPMNSSERVWHQRFFNFMWLAAHGEMFLRFHNVEHLYKLFCYSLLFRKSALCDITIRIF